MPNLIQRLFPKKFIGTQDQFIKYVLPTILSKNLFTDKNTAEIPAHQTCVKILTENLA